MSRIRYFVHQLDASWSVHRDCQSLGSFGNVEQATAMAAEHAAIDRVRGHAVQVLKLEEDGRWAPCPLYGT